MLAKSPAFFSQAKQIIKTPNGLAMLGLGFGCGLPYPLMGSTLGFWLSETSVPIGIIGAFSWTMLPYSIKFLWAKFLDTREAPFLGSSYKQRRGWIILSQLMVTAALIALLIAGHFRLTFFMAFFCLVAAFAGASQDISVDAFRIESGLAFSNSSEILTHYQLGYRVALLLSDGIVFLLATHIGWVASYAIMTSIMVLPIVAAYRSKERAIIPSKKITITNKDAYAYADDVETVSETMTPTKKAWIVIFIIIAFYRLPDVIIYPMINPLYHDAGISKDFLAIIHIGIGVISSFFGILAGGFCATRLGIIRTMKFGAMVQIVAMILFSALAFSHGSHLIAMLSGALENATASFTGISLILYMSQFITAGRAAAQYAALTCVYSLFGKILSGLSGFFIDYIGQSSSRLQGYGTFFLLISVTGLPAIALLSSARKHKIGGILPLA